MADDNKVNRLLLCRSLALMGHEVHSVEDGQAALARLRAERFDLLLLDLEMPQLGGFDLLALRSAEPALRAVPVIVTSSIEGAAQVARCIELGADDFLHKPVNPVLLQARVASSLERKHLNDRQRELLARLAPGLPEGLPLGPMLSGTARRGMATLLAARLQGLEQLAAGQSPQETLEQLSNWATLMLDAIESRGGQVNHLGSDGLSAVFGLSGAAAPSGSAATGATGEASEADGASVCALQAVREMEDLTALFNAELLAAAKAGIAVGIGLARGDVVAGHAGTAQRAAHVCIGDAVQRAAALATLAAGATARSVLCPVGHARQAAGAHRPAAPHPQGPGALGCGHGCHAGRCSTGQSLRPTREEVTAPMLSAPQPLAGHHQFADFDSGEPSLDDWLKRRAARNQANGSSRTYVVCEGQDQDRVIGYYCLAVGAIGHAEAPSTLKRNRPDPVPVLVLGRLAIHKDHHQKGIGTALLNDAIRRDLQAADIVGVTALLVHAISEQARRFNLSRGFIAWVPPRWPAR